jgi:hypothetical protein
VKKEEKATRVDDTQYGAPLATAATACACADLLAALKGLLREAYESGNGTARDFGWPAAISAARAAIEKAEGLA